MNTDKNRDRVEGVKGSDQNKLHGELNCFPMTIRFSWTRPLYLVLVSPASYVRRGVKRLTSAAVKQGGGHNRVTEHLDTIGDGSIGGQDRGAFLVACTDQLENKLTLSLDSGN